MFLVFLEFTAVLFTSLAPLTRKNVYPFHFLTAVPFSSRHSTSFYTSAFWISYLIKGVVSPSVLLTIQHYRRWTLWMPWKVGGDNVDPIDWLVPRAEAVVS